MISNNMEAREIVNYIINLDVYNRKKVLKDENTRNIIFKDSNHYSFVWLVQELEDQDILYLLDDNLIKFLVNDSNFINKLNAIMTSGNKYINNFISNDIMVESIVNNIDNLYYYIKDCDDVFANKFLNYILKNKMYNNLKYLGEFNSKTQLNLFTIDNIVELFKIKDLSYLFVLNLNEEVIMKLLKFDYFKSKFLEFDIENINYITSKSNFRFEKEFMNKNKLKEKYLNIENPNKYILSLNLLEKNNLELYNGVCSKKKSWLDNQVLNKSLDKDELIKNIIVIYFKDIYQNFLINLKTILDFNFSIDKSLIPLDRLKIYKTIINYKNLDETDIYNLYQELESKKDIDYSKLFYEDFNMCKNYSINMYNDKFIKPSKKLNIYNKDLSKKYGVDIYYLDGEEFLGCVHTTGYQNASSLNWMPDKKKTISLSIIGDKNITTYNEGFGYITLGFSNLSSDNIIHVSNTDSFTNSTYSTDKIQRIYTPDDLLENSVGYNEILYKENNNYLYPNYVVSFDEITDEEINVSKRFNIPIVLVNSNKYNKKIGLESISENIYYR